MISGHHGLAACQPYHRLVGQQDFLHQFLLLSIAATAVAEVVFRAGTDTLLQVVLLQSLHKGHAHYRRQVSILAVRLLQAVERGRAAHIDHRRQRQYATHLPHGSPRLTGLQLSQFWIERASLPYLLRIDGSPTGIDARQHLLVEQGRNTVWCILHQPVLNGGHTVAQFIGVTRFLTGILREVADTVGYQLTAFHRVQPPLVVEELVHIHAPQLGDTFLLRHLVVQFVYLLFCVYGGTTACQQCTHAHDCHSFHTYFRFLFLIPAFDSHLACKVTKKREKYKRKARFSLFDESTDFCSRTQ